VTLGSQKLRGTGGFFSGKRPRNRKRVCTV